MPFSKFSKDYFGSNYRKAERNYRNGVAIERSRFQKRHPSADISKFEFDADLRWSNTKNIIFFVSDVIRL